MHKRRRLTIEKYFAKQKRVSRNTQKRERNDETKVSNNLFNKRLQMFANFLFFYSIWFTEISFFFYITRKICGAYLRRRKNILSSLRALLQLSLIQLFGKIWVMSLFFHYFTIGYLLWL